MSDPVFCSADGRFIVYKEEELNRLAHSLVYRANWVVLVSEDGTFSLVKDRYADHDATKMQFKEHFGVNIYMHDWDERRWSFRESKERVIMKLKYGI